MWQAPKWNDPQERGNSLLGRAMIQERDETLDAEATEPNHQSSAGRPQVGISLGLWWSIHP
jgi:hypothetical protein